MDFMPSAILSPFPPEFRIVPPHVPAKNDPSPATSRLAQIQTEAADQSPVSAAMLADGLAHDLNNILAPLLMGIHLLKQKPQDSASQELLDVMEISAGEGVALVSQILSFAKKTKGPRSTIPTRHLVMEAFATAMETLPQSIAPEMNLALNLWKIAIDPVQLREVLLNLCANARDAMPDGGELILSAQNAVLDEHSAATFPGASAGPHVVIEVRDTGAGMSRETLARVFEPFFSTRDFEEGAGLGLSAAFGIVKRHGGFIQVQSEAGQGSTFKVHLPAAASGKLPANNERRAEYSRGHGELVLVVDDDAPMRTITRQTLEAFGYRVLLASNGEDAAAIYAGRQTEIAVVLMDMMMPVQDGPATIQVLASMNPGVRVIATSGHQCNQRVAEAIGPAVKSFLPKPYNAKTLLSVVASSLGDGEAAA